MVEKMVMAIVMIAWPLAVGYSLYKWLCRDITRAAASAFRS